ncbi:Nif3-like dinuclear metal center hexameric protein [Oceanobacillus profundus]|uniref:GTP cyclohydrolase 1 type 2 homolog n=1 Tax=Oceanobacillus profundus TaxID=372463 RepID=A0A417YJL2_9BACI|nr:Nif3-like dinuclear metal center hexameric protein [Oceanobacillus profundus]MBR3121353.1 Nif3-like dinuclear metal center hexameric protein [Oceanobacillus sp.]PAE31127.1 Nif3-like dinuclear metal center hexameric protein [Paenibacillus sp. 7884-2]MCM3396841.1 Nif3-like dinuclear metal center hexameric protein [Oceanobacillus profundus]MDO6448141.1 Nif3-like dinuclear metal center hexameric protein [Oceanobacillus profundus]RHW33170.1 Nif3-like dinuclear metal center hexameric protein [Oce
MKNNVTNSDVFQLMEQWAPKELAYDWDNVGLQIGSYHNPVTKVLITLDVMENVVDEAIEKGANLIIAHHPFLFKPIKQVNIDTPQGRVIQKLLENHISVYATHTNLDIAPGGVNDMLTDALELEENDMLVETDREKLYKVAVYVPETHIDEVREAFGESGAGHIGNYSHCTFQSKGQGTFKPLEGSQPFLGAKNELELVNEVKMETIVPKAILHKVINAIVAAHPYEEVAYDVFPLENEGKRYGIGRIGSLKNKTDLNSFCEYVKKALDIPALRVTGDLNKKIQKVAVLGGSGEKYIHHAKKKGADVYITGDMTFHMAQEASLMGLGVIDAGHYIEKIMKQFTAAYLKEHLDKENLTILVSESNTDPFQFV